MSFDAFRENRILAKISKFTVIFRRYTKPQEQTHCKISVHVSVH